MNDTIEHAKEIVEEHAGHSDKGARGVAVMVSILAAALALTEIGAKSSQNAYLTHHVSLSNQWAFYQAKNVRATILTSEGRILESLPNAADPAIQARIKETNEFEAHLRDDPKAGDGTKQLAAAARAEEIERDEVFHKYHIYEYASGAIEIAIVLASVSIVTRMLPLAVGAGLLGGIASLVSLAVATGLF